MTDFRRQQFFWVIVAVGLMLFVNGYTFGRDQNVNTGSLVAENIALSAALNELQLELFHKSALLASADSSLRRYEYATEMARADFRVDIEQMKAEHKVELARQEAQMHQKVVQAEVRAIHEIARVKAELELVKAQYSRTEDSGG